LDKNIKYCLGIILDGHRGSDHLTRFCSSDYFT